MREVNAGLYAGKTELLRRALAQIQPNNSQGEYYLTDVIAWVARTSRVTGVLGHADALLGVNDRGQLAEAEEIMLRRIRLRHAKNGVTVARRSAHRRQRRDRRRLTESRLAWFCAVKRGLEKAR